MSARQAERFVFTAHAVFEMRRRGIDEGRVRRVVEHPEQRIDMRPGREVRQARERDRGREYLIRVVVDVDRSPAEVVTVYRTSKVAKYWGRES